MGAVRDVREAAVAGWFYPLDREGLRREVEALCGKAPLPLPSEPQSKGFLVPHAGYAFSGPIAGSAFARLRSESIRRAVVLGPSHHVAFEGLALPNARAFETPLGRVPVDEEAIASLHGLPQVHVLPVAHAQEHAIEVELPFLQARLEEFSLVPLVVGEASPEAVEEVIEALWGGSETLFLISSDLSHYLPYEEARRTDARTCEAIAQLERLRGPGQACGAVPLNGWMRAARYHGLHPRALDVRNSGDTAGDKGRVVGYASFAFSPGGDRDH